MGGMRGELVGMKGSGRKGENFSQLVHSSSLMTSQTESPITESPITELARLEPLGRRRLEMRWEASREAVRVGRDMVDFLITAKLDQFYHVAYTRTRVSYT